VIIVIVTVLIERGSRRASRPLLTRSRATAAQTWFPIWRSSQKGIEAVHLVLEVCIFRFELLPRFSLPSATGFQKEDNRLTRD
jgi:hypothetical protein